MERRLSTVSVVLSGCESLTPPGWDTNPSQVSSQQMLVLIYLPWKDGKLNWLRRERKSHKSVQISAEPGIELGTLWSQGRDLTNCTNHAHPMYYYASLKSLKQHLKVSPFCTQILQDVM